MIVDPRPDDAHDRALLEAVRPAGWLNPEPPDRYDLVAIGAGAAGLVSAIGAAGLGARAAIVERRLLGGDCLNHGCVPSKALLASARAAADVRRAAGFGVSIPGPVQVDFARVMERVRGARARIAPHDSAERLRGLGVDVHLGQAVFAGPDSLEVAGRTLRFRRAVIATGARPAAPPVPGLAEAGFLTNETVFGLGELPAALAVIGGGPIGCELGQAFARLGSSVTILEVAPRLMTRDDPEAADLVRRALEADGVEVLAGAAIRKVGRVDGRREIEVEHEGAVRTIGVDEILVAAGRAPNVEGLGLEAAGVEYEPGKGVRVDDRLRTTNPLVYAAGDVCGLLQFTHAADAMARIVLTNALFPGRARVGALVVPWCTYTEPEVAHVGWTEADATARGIDVEVYRHDAADDDRSIVDGTTEGFVKVLVRRGTDRIVGATIAGPGAGERIGEFGLAIGRRLGLGVLGSAIRPYPTRSEAVRRLADQYRRSRLGPVGRWLLEKWFAWRR